MAVEEAVRGEAEEDTVPLRESEGDLLWLGEGEEVGVLPGLREEEVQPVALAEREGVTEVLVDTV